MFFMSLVLHLTYYPLVVSLVPLIVLFLLTKIHLLYRTGVWDGWLAPNVSLLDSINYRSLHMLARLCILHLSFMLSWVILVLPRCSNLFQVCLMCLLYRVSRVSYVESSVFKLWRIQILWWLMEGWMCLLLLMCFRIGSGVDYLCKSTLDWIWSLSILKPFNWKCFSN